MNTWKSYLHKFPKLPRYVLWGGASFFLLALLWTIGVFKGAPPQSSPKEPAPKITTPGQVISSKELWVHRIEGKAEDIHKEVDNMRSQNQALRQQIDMMQEMVETVVKNQLEAQNSLKDRQIALDEGSIVAPSQDALVEDHMVTKKSSFKILSLAENELPPLPKDKPKSVEEIIPAGTYAAGILTSGIAASTALNAQSDPQPVMVRLTSPGMLPRGFKTDIKEAVVIAACYGDISSERANCRLNKLLLVERNGEILSKKAEGWLIGDDGIPGVKGKVVDKAGEVVRSSFWAGLLGGIASYFKAAADQPQFLLTGGGAAETKKIPHGDMLKSAGASGVGNALDRIADFALKRAEQMQPVIIVNPGRAVDVVFKEEVDLSNSTVRKELILRGSSKREEHAYQEASKKEVQLTGEF